MNTRQNTHTHILRSHTTPYDTTLWSVFHQSSFCLHRQLGSSEHINGSDGGTYRSRQRTDFKAQSRFSVMCAHLSVSGFLIPVQIKVLTWRFFSYTLQTKGSEIFPRIP